jgi:PAS domain S-box-containing protein
VLTEESARTLHAIFADSPAAVGVFDRLGRAIYANAALLDMSGCTPEELAGQFQFDFLHPDDRARVHDVFTTIVAAGTSRRLSARARTGDGSYRALSLDLSVGHALSDEPVRVVIVQDVSEHVTVRESARAAVATSVLYASDEPAVAPRERDMERERLYQEARAARAEAEAANRSKDDFLATLSHELRAPLSAVLGWARILRARGLDDKTNRALAVIERNAEIQRRLIDDLLDISRIIAGKIELQRAPVDLVFIVHGALESVRPLAESRRLTLREMLDPVPPVWGDAQRLQQVVSNLLTNAVKFTDPGGVIEVAVAARGGEVEIAVSDNGIGLSAEDVPVIFERFRQVSSGRAHGGLGLGLAIVEHLVQLHSGTVTVRSGGPGQGSTFRVLLPAMDRRAEPRAS